MNFSRNVDNDTRNRLLHFGLGPDLYLDLGIILTIFIIALISFLGGVAPWCYFILEHPELCSQ